MQRGMSEAEARRRAQIAFGGTEHFKEEYRDGRGDRGVAEVRSDIAYALRLLKRNPVLTAAALATLAIGIGACVALFTVVNAVIFRPLPYNRPDQLVVLWESNPDKGWTRETSAPANLLDWQEQVRSFEDVAGYTSFANFKTLLANGTPRVLRAVAVTGNYFDVLGVQPSFGRGFESTDTWQSGEAKAVLSFQLFRDQLGADSTKIGQTITLDGVPVRVLGVMPPSFVPPGVEADLWMPTAWDPADRSQVYFRRAHWMRPIARVKSGVTLEAAHADLVSVMRRLEQQYPETNTHMGAGLTLMQEFLVGGTRRPLLVLLGATGLLLLIACANVGNLLLVRAASREREIVVRRALGASARRLVRQALTESVTLSSIGAALGLGVGWSAVRLFQAQMPPRFLPFSDLSPDLRVYLFVASVAVVSGALFGIVPALWNARRDPGDVLKESTRSGTESHRSRSWGQALVIGEVAVALLLTVGAGLLVRSFSRLSSVEMGFDVEGTVAMSLSLNTDRYDTREKRLEFYEQISERIRALPGVTAAGVVASVPLGNYEGWTSDLSVRGRPAESAVMDIAHRELSPEYFETMGVPVLKGRNFGPSDGATSEPVVILNSAAAAMIFPGEDPIGQYVAFDKEPDSSSVWRRIVGVVGSERQRTLAVDPKIEVFVPFAQSPRGRAVVVVRSSAPMTAMASALRVAVAAQDPNVAPLAIRTMAEYKEEALGRDRTLTALFLAFAVMGALLALIGVYGVIAQITQRRYQEIGIRVALGARAQEIRWMIVRQGLVLTGIGILIGLGLALVVGGAMRQLLFGVTPTDPATLVGMPLVLLVTAGLATLVPAFRATRRDPARVLRNGGGG